MSGCNRIRKIAAHYIYTPEGELKQRIVVVDQTGTILALESYPSQGIDASAGVEFYDGVIVPGLINAHTHLELSHLRGQISPGRGFAEFAREISEKRELFTEQQIVEAAQLEDSVMWQQGVQAVGDISNGKRTFEIKKKSKIHYHTFIEVFGLRLQSMERVWELIDHQLEQSITPHSTYSLNEEMFKRAIEAHNKRGLSIHFMESEAEAELYKGEGELVEMLSRSGMECDFGQKYSSPADRILRNISGERKILLVHNTHTSKQEMEAIQNHFKRGVTWVICPRSNQYIANQTPPFELLLGGGARVAIGTDSLASNRSLSLIDELKMIPKSVPLERLLSMATKEGAEALGVEDRYGSIEVGRAPGIVLLEGVDLERGELKANAATRRLI